MDIYIEDNEVHNLKKSFIAILELFRIPFHSVGTLPLLLGGILAWMIAGIFYWDIFLWGLIGVILIMLSTYTAGEYWDVIEDALISQLSDGKNITRFSGGSQVIQRGLLPRNFALKVSIVSLFLAIVTGVILVFIYQVGFLVIPLGILGLIGGFFYSTEPIRWVKRGLGEIWIAFCYGWLPVVVAFYLQTRMILPIIYWVGMPIGLTIFNVILLNEFPDYEADLEAGKRNLVVRLGQRRAAYLYSLASVISWLGVIFSPYFGIPLHLILFYSPILVLSGILVVLILKGKWQDNRWLKRLCGLNILVNLGTTTVFILALLW